MMTLRLQTRCAVCGVLMQAKLDLPDWPKTIRLNCPRLHLREYDAKDLLSLEYRRDDQRSVEAAA
jgi:hypothetical protein